MSGCQKKSANTTTAVIHPRSVKGRFRNMKTMIMVLAYAAFFIFPWIPFARNVGPDQAVSFDLVTRKFYIFHVVIHAQDIFWLAALLFLAAVVLFFATALAGRVFCGYFCFQTLWTDAFRWIEQKIQGDRVARIRLDRDKWNANKIFRKGSTHALWLLLAFWTGLSFVLYWGYAPELIQRFFTLDLPSAAYITTFVLMATTYLAAGIMRENVCMHICPYARFQSVMIDHNSKIVSYDPKRGEGTAGRALPKKGLKTQEERSAKGVGDCVDCGFCVQVCPTGIDIRDGLQLQCIQCGLCIDACDNIMDKRGWDRGLVRYASENELDGKKTKFFTLRTLGYGLATLGAIGFLLGSISMKKPIEGTARQIRSPLYIMLSDGQIQNRYEVKVQNKTQKLAVFDVTIDGLNNATVDMGQIKNFTLKPDESQKLLIKVLHERLTGEYKDIPFRFVLTPTKGEVTEPVYLPSQFISP
ncbi:MAG: Type cbb3 cytochrome oxidase biogenesis protein CcoG, involved in Cu oxidation [uncultured Thiotrichaceae bacterium]|uniref:Type cbb3 cytochrome oxidase biogenesis protein CcoG, involved in Cu oxidation n=1 Tax=uncultured Thiotrichaceae bacterium TaxID=298394 RepID=A0A6S6TA75_9GAMM|nr:MAG: Type cbb3 cytochrome oxidase biogenesis protein CcoG, involved in Cu oxidation [uncultured Thiotrichaceae bacterium]